MDSATRLETKNDVSTSDILTKEKSKAQLLIDLRRAGVDTTKRRFLKPELLELVHLHNVDTSSTTPVVIPG